ncbi:cytochrome P450 [Mucor mucedo]|uniref:cytochrome P450 n=1 Tax=Mucor mucedo TaxID=29922 RepID=UPI00221EC062|nr:cytochrome P450 [Mucor mucedo]KAI7889564.1 cytochrome P450 [Mucor mucedo]
MEYLNTASKSISIHNAVQLTGLIQHRLTDIYKRSTKNELMFIGAATFFALYHLPNCFKSRKKKLNLPPKVPFALPFFGHSLYLIVWPCKFLDWCHQKYGDIYTLNMLGKTITIAGGKSAEESMAAESSDMSLDHGVLRDILHFDYLFDETTMYIGVYVTATVAKFSLANARMPMYEADLRRGMANACERYLSSPTTVIEHPMAFFQNFVSYMSVPVLLGAEFSLNTEVIESFANCTADITRNVVFYMMTPNSLHKKVLPYIQSSQKHLNCMIKHVAPAIYERREKMRLGELSGQEHGLVENFLQGVIEYVQTDENGVESYCSAEQISKSILLVAFASVHTTSINLSFSLHWLLARPDLMKKMMDEIEQVIPGDTEITGEALSKMKFLNNFMREVLRQGADKLGVSKKAMSDFTFSNGYQIPEGRLVNHNLRQMNFGDNSTRTRVNEMDPDMSRDKISTAPGKNFASFGLGKHLCPGRFFAIQEIQTTLVYLLKNYEIKTASGKPPVPVQRTLGFIATSPEEPLIFTRKN